MILYHPINETQINPARVGNRPRRRRWLFPRNRVRNLAHALRLFRHFAREARLRRLDNCSILFALIGQEQEELARTSYTRTRRRDADAGPDSAGPLLQEIACGTTHLQRTNVTYCVAASLRAARSVLRRFFAMCPPTGR